MESHEDFKRISLPFGKPQSVSNDAKEILLNTYGNIRAAIVNGVITIQTKKLKGSQREVVRIDTNVHPPTIELAIEELTE